MEDVSPTDDVVAGIVRRWQDIRPEDDGRLFYQKRSWQKLIIMAGGPMMNIVLAFLILLGVSLTYGVYRTQLQITQVQQCIVVQGSPANDCAGKPPTPAAQSGIRPGDVVVAFNGQAVSSWDEVSELKKELRQMVEANR